MRSLALIALGVFLIGCGSGGDEMKPEDSMAGELKKAGPATGEVGGKDGMKKPENATK